MNVKPNENTPRTREGGFPMRGSMKLVSMLLVLCLMLGALPLAKAEEVVDADLTCTITLGNWPADTAAEAEKALLLPSSTKDSTLILFTVINEVSADEKNADKTNKITIAISWIILSVSKKNPSSLKIKIFLLILQYAHCAVKCY